MKATLNADQLAQAWREAYLMDAAKYSPYAWAKTDPGFLQALEVTLNRILATEALAAEGELKTNP